MVDSDRVLRPLNEAETAIERLGGYETPEELADALATAWGAVERSLRYLLRTDAGAPDEVRLAALSPKDLPTDRLLAELRRRDLVSLNLAGRVHELERAAVRALRGEVHARDADAGLDVVRRLRAEVAERVGAGEVHHRPEPAPEPGPPADPGMDGLDPDEAAPLRRRDVRRVGALALAGLVLIAVVIAVVRTTGGSDVEEGVRAFRDGRLGLAEEHFRAVVERDADDATARLYLGRVYRRTGRYEEAARVLREAAAIAPDDADVRRELGHLFMELNQPASAARQYRRAQELEPADRLNWLGLIRALHAAGDPEAGEVLRRAPPDVRAALDSAAA